MLSKSHYEAYTHGYKGERPSAKPRSADIGGSPWFRNRSKRRLEVGEEAGFLSR